MPTLRLRAALVLFAASLAGCAPVTANSAPPSLDGTAWILSSLPGHTLVGRQPITLHFEGGRVAGSDGCNRYSGPFTATGGALSITKAAASTMMACDEPLMQADAALSGLLAQPLTVALTRGPTPVLRLSTPAQQVLSFSGQPTLRSLYGAPKRVFLEVAAQTAQCSQPSATAGSCLQVRELRFDGKGLRKDPPGPWRPFDGSIEGFTHTPGVRNVLRIDRYERKPAPADGPAAVYVLDLVVESETVAGK